MPVREVIAFASSDDAVSKAEFWHVYFSMASEKGKKKKKRGGGGRRGEKKCSKVPYISG